MKAIILAIALLLVASPVNAGTITDSPCADASDRRRARTLVMYGGTIARPTRDSCVVHMSYQVAKQRIRRLFDGKGHRFYTHWNEYRVFGRSTNRGNLANAWNERTHYLEPQIWYEA